MTKATKCYQRAVLYPLDLFSFNQRHDGEGLRGVTGWDHGRNHGGGHCCFPILGQVTAEKAARSNRVTKAVGNNWEEDINDRISVAVDRVNRGGNKTLRYGIKFDKISRQIPKHSFW